MEPEQGVDGYEYEGVCPDRSANKALGVDEKTHLAMFKAVWTTGN
jgi:hypothetical protein